MKVHNDLKELLEAHTKWVLKLYTLSDGKYTKSLDRAFLASNSLALGKPEPLAKNKQCDDDLCNCKSNHEFMLTDGDSYCCCGCKKPIA